MERANDKKEINKTGGGKFNLQLTETGARILSLVGEQITPLQNPYDDGAIYHGDVAVNSSPQAIFEQVEVLCNVETTPELFTASDVPKKNAPVGVASPPVTSIGFFLSSVAHHR